MRNKTKKIFADIKILDEDDRRLFEISQPLEKAYLEFDNILKSKFGIKKRKK